MPWAVYKSCKAGEKRDMDEWIPGLWSESDEWRSTISCSQSTNLMTPEMQKSADDYAVKQTMERQQLRQSFAEFFGEDEATKIYGPPPLCLISP